MRDAIDNGGLYAVAGKACRSCGEAPREASVERLSRCVANLQPSGKGL